MSSHLSENKNIHLKHQRSDGTLIQVNTGAKYSTGLRDPKETNAEGLSIDSKQKDLWYEMFFLTML